MSAIQDVAKTSATGTTAATSAATTSSEIQDRFLKLLVTQLKNQDPLNPLDNAQITSQLSQISTVYGSLTTAIALLMSLEIAATLLLLGAQVIAEYERVVAPGGQPPVQPFTTPAH